MARYRKVKPMSFDELKKQIARIEQFTNNARPEHALLIRALVDELRANYNRIVELSERVEK